MLAGAAVVSSCLLTHSGTTHGRPLVTRPPPRTAATFSHDKPGTISNAAIIKRTLNVKQRLKYSRRFPRSQYE